MKVSELMEFCLVRIFQYKALEESDDVRGDNFLTAYYRGHVRAFESVADKIKYEVLGGNGESKMTNDDEVFLINMLKNYIKTMEDYPSIPTEFEEEHLERAKELIKKLILKEK